jgi:hypothetical protein
VHIMVGNAFSLIGCPEMGLYRDNIVKYKATSLKKRKKVKYTISCRRARYTLLNEASFMRLLKGHTRGFNNCGGSPSTLLRKPFAS